MLEDAAGQLYLSVRGPRFAPVDRPLWPSQGDFDSEPDRFA
jgi:hypothetical protein